MMSPDDLAGDGVGDGDGDTDGPFIERTLRALDGALGAEEQAAWKAELAGDVDRRRLFVRLCLQSRALAEVAGLRRRAQELPDEEAVLAAAPRRPWLPWSIAAAACLLAAISLGTGSRRVGGDRPPPGKAPAPKADPVVALLVNEAGAHFDGDAGPRSVRFGTGAYHLTGGTVHLRFTSGADVVIRAPARYLIHDPMHMTLEEGVLRAVVPDSAHGFTVAAPGVDYEDLGTEFGVAVSAAREESELHVFEGLVDLKTPAGQWIAQVALGNSVRVVGGAVGPTTPADPSRFPTPGAVGFHRWNQWRETLQADPSLICYYPFIEDPEDDRLLRDHARHGTGEGEGPPTSGRIRGARWVSGRWEGKQALLFDRDGDAVELTLPGPYRQITMAAWMNIDRLDFVHTAILNSDGWDPGDFHWQLTRLGEERAGINGFDPKQVVRYGSTVPLGQWVHHAVVVDLDRSLIRVFINGELYKEGTAGHSLPALAFGPCRIGDWLRRPDWEDSPRRGLRGRIDEFAVWRRALSPEEIRGLVMAGWPSLLSAVEPVTVSNSD